jgi:cation transport ATPase
MPKKQPKPNSKNQRKTKPKEKQSKAQPASASIIKSKNYWIFLSILILVFTIVFGFLAQISVGKELLILGSVFAIIGFAFYLAFKPAATDKRRIAFILIGVSIIGFSIWAITVLYLNLTGSLIKIENSVGDTFFSVTSLIICLAIGAFVGDLIHKNMDIILSLARSFRSRVTDSAPKKIKP